MKTSITISDFMTSDGTYKIPNFEVAYAILERLGRSIHKRAAFGDPTCTNIMNNFRAYQLHKDQFSLHLLLKFIGEFLDQLELEDSIWAKEDKEKMQ